MVNSKEYFYLCIKELEKKYNIISKENIKTEFDDLWLEQGKKQLSKLRKCKISNFLLALNENKQYYLDLKDYSKIDEVQDIINNYNNDIQKLTFSELEINYFNNEKCSGYISKFIENDLKINGYSKDAINYNEIKERYLKYYFYSDILNINNIDEYLLLLDITPKISKIGIYNIDNIYNEAKSSYENLIKNKNDDLSCEFKQIINNKFFFEKLKSILASSSIQNCLKNKRSFIYGKNNVEILNDKENVFDDDLKLAYEEFIIKLNKSFDWFKKLIIIKYLSPNKRAFVNPLMKIIINSLFIKFTNLLKKDKIMTKEILEAYLIVILVHEIVNLLKFRKKEFTFDNVPSTPKDKKEGKILINYLFNIQIINCIDYEHAKQINNVENWKDLNNLRKIFTTKTFNLNEGKKEVEEINYEYENEYNIKFYSSDFDESKENIDELDNWYDID